MTPDETAVALQDEANALWDELGGGMRDFDGFQVTPSICVDGVQLFQLELWGGARTTPLPPDDIREAGRRYLHSRLGREARPRRKATDRPEEKPMTATAEQLQETVLRVPLDDLAPSPLNPRKHLGSLDELAESIGKVGVLEPLVARACRPGADGTASYELVFGHRRHAAAKLAKADTVPVIVRDYTDDQVVEAQVIENAHRADVHPLDEADGFKMMLARGYTPQRLADRVARSLSYVLQRLKLCDLSKKCREALDKEDITLGVALLLARLPNATLQDKGLEEVTMHSSVWDGGGVMSVAEARKALEANVMLALKSAPFKRDDATLVPKAGPCTTCPKRTGTQAELFADASSPDLCTDPGCYREKVDALWQIRSKEHKAAGGDVLSQKDAKALLGHTWSSENREIRNRFVKLDERLYDGGKAKTVKALFKGELPPVTIAKDPETGLIVELVSRSAVEKAKGAASKADRSKPDASAAAAARRERLKDLARKEATRQSVGAIVKKVEALAWDAIGAKLLRPLALATLEATWHDGRSELAKRRGWLDGSERPQPKSRSRVAPAGEAVEDAIAMASPAELAGVIVELVLSRGAPTRWRDKPGEEWDAVADAMGVDYQAVHANVVEAQRADEKAKKAAAKAKPKAKAKKPAAKKPAAKSSSPKRAKPGELETKARRLKKAVEEKGLKPANGKAVTPKKAKGTPGTCRGCGCTDAEGCEGGCYWADEEHTLCSNCAGTSASSDGNERVSDQETGSMRRKSTVDDAIGV